MKAPPEPPGPAARRGPAERAAGDTSGLTSGEAAARLARDGPNAIPEAHRNMVLAFLAKLWGPVPWLLEAAIVLELALGNLAQALIIAILVGLDAVLSFREEGDAQAALDLLRQRLSVEARVCRDGDWAHVPAAELVRDDLVHVRQGDLVPADLICTTGEVSLDQSALTGESNAVTVTTGGRAYSGAIVVRGEASGQVEATGTGTFFGRTAKLVGSSHAPGRLEQLIMGFVKALLILDVALVAVVLADGALHHQAWATLLPFAVILIVAAVPVALPTTFTLASALGSRELADKGVLVTRLAAIEEAASMEVLCSDKTGTITENHLSLASLKTYGSCEEAHLLAVAAAASDDATQDPLDPSILAGLHTRGIADGGPSQGHHEAKGRVDHVVARREGSHLAQASSEPGADRCAQRAGFLLGAEQLSKLSSRLEVQRRGHPCDVEDADRKGRRRADRKHVARGPDAIHCSGDHSKARGVHEAARRQVQRHLTMTEVDHRVDDGTELGSGDKVDLAPNGEHHLRACELHADRESASRDAHHDLALFPLGASTRTGRRGG